MGREGGEKERGERAKGRGQDRAPENDTSPLTIGGTAVSVLGGCLDTHCPAENNANHDGI